jgi:CRISPR-associated protein Cmr6
LLPEYVSQENDRNVFHVALKGEGVSPLLLDKTKTPEFRPNMFKATLRGHFSRLLAGVCDCDPAVEAEVNRLLGGPDRRGNDREGVIKLFWESHKLDYNWEKCPTSYETEGVLHIATNSKAQINDLNFVRGVLKFAYIMGGVGKSWRRVWHEKFYPDYFQQEEQKFHIGCHWESLTPTWGEFQQHNASQQLQDFLAQVYQQCCDRLGSHPPKSLNWRESWHPDRVLVYSKVVSDSKIVRLFHNEKFKTTPAIGGRTSGEKRPTSVSSVWHRMLPLPNNQYLEIVTVFHGDRTAWKRQGQDQLNPFIKAIKSALKITPPTWGNESKL